MEKIKKYSLINIVEMFFQILFLIYTMLGFNSLTFGNSIISKIMWCAYLLGGVLILIRLWNWKKYVKFPGTICLVIMCIISVISIMINYQYDIKRNIIYLIFWVVYFFLFFVNSDDCSIQTVKRDICIIAHIICIGGFILTIISLCMMLNNYSEITQINGSEIIRGFVDGRLYGAYLTPNSGAVFGSVIILFSIYYFKQYKNRAYRFFCVLNCLIQFLYIVFSDSRSGMLSLSFGCAVYTFFYLFNNEKITKKRYEIVKILFVTVIVLLIVLFLPKIVQNFYNKILVSISISEETENDSIHEIADTQEENIADTQEENIADTQEENVADTQEDVVEEKNPLEYQIDRGYSLKGDISNRRFDVWKSGVEIFYTRPWFGITFSGLLPYAKENLPNTYIVNNDYMNMNTLDNDFMNLLVSNGIFCFGVYIVFVIWIVCYLFNKIIKKRIKDSQIPVMFGVCMAVATFSMVTSGILYMHSPYSVMFWFALGKMIVILREKERGSVYE